MSVRDPVFLQDVLDGLRAAPRSLPSKYLYDAEGSVLFERITTLDAYYPTRTERAILARCVPDVARLVGAGAVVIEYGSGSSSKTRVLLDGLRDAAAYVPIDISREHLLDSAAGLAAEYESLTVVPIVADYTRRLELPVLPPGPRLAFFPGSTIGNFDPAEARAFLGCVRDTVGVGGWLLLGVDLVKDAAVLELAYDDPQGVTAAFNRNVLVRINRELGADFAPDAFEHKAVYASDAGRVEMHLVAGTDQRVSVAGERFRFRAGESIHTENAYKYTIQGAEALARSAGFALVESWNDARDWFAVLLLRADLQVDAAR